MPRSIVTSPEASAGLPAAGSSFGSGGISATVTASARVGAASSASFALARSRLGRRHAANATSANRPRRQEAGQRTQPQRPAGHIGNAAATRRSLPGILAASASAPPASAVSPRSRTVAAALAQGEIAVVRQLGLIETGADALQRQQHVGDAHQLLADLGRCRHRQLRRALVLHHPRHRLAGGDRRFGGREPAVAGLRQLPVLTCEIRCQDLRLLRRRPSPRPGACRPSPGRRPPAPPAWPASPGAPAVRMYSVFSAAAADCGGRVADLLHGIATGFGRDAAASRSTPATAATRPLATATTGNNCFSEACSWARLGIRFGHRFSPCQRTPVWPKPPAPRALVSNSSTTCNVARTIGNTTSCAMRSPGCDRESLAAAVPDADQQRALVVGIDQPGAVAQHDPVLMAQAGARQDHRAHGRVADVDRQARRNQRGIARLQRQRRVQRRAQVEAGTGLGGVGRASAIHRRSVDPAV